MKRIASSAMNPSSLLLAIWRRFAESMGSHNRPCQAMAHRRRPCTAFSVARHRVFRRSGRVFARGRLRGKRAHGSSPNRPPCRAALRDRFQKLSLPPSAGEVVSPNRPGVRASRSENTRFEGKCHSLSVTRERVSWKNVGSLTLEGLASFFAHRFILPGFSSNIKVTERR